jgi:hypothetical protein
MQIVVNLSIDRSGRSTLIRGASCSERDTLLSTAPTAAKRSHEIPTLESEIAGGKAARGGRVCASSRRAS